MGSGASQSRGSWKELPGVEDGAAVQSSWLTSQVRSESLKATGRTFSCLPRVAAVRDICSRHRIVCLWRMLFL